ncbi:hypothetical protein AMTRI_Chr04g186070 [Amborella trichopoda]
MTRVSGTIIVHNNLSTKGNETVIAHYKFCSRWWGIVSRARARTGVSGTKTIHNKINVRGWGVVSHSRAITRVSGTEIVHNKFCARGRGVMSHSRAMPRVGGTELLHNKFGARGRGVVSYSRAMTGVSGTEVVLYEFHCGNHRGLVAQFLVGGHHISSFSKVESRKRDEKKERKQSMHPRHIIEDED